MTYNHITGWDIKSINLESTYSTNWTESNYWRHKQVATNEVAHITDSLIATLHQVLTVMGRTVDLSTFSNELQKSKYYAELLKEYIFEDVRRNEFPDKPSRKSCMFLMPVEIDPFEFGRLLNYDMTAKHIIQVDVLNNSKVHHADIKLLDCNTLTHSDKVDAARKYWGGTNKLDFDTEVLFVGDFKMRIAPDESNYARHKQ